MSLNELINELQTKLNRKSKEVDQLKEKLAAHEGGAAGKSSSADVDALKKTLQEKDQQIKVLQEKVASSGSGSSSTPLPSDIGGLATELQKKIKRRDVRIEELEKEVTNLKQEVSEWKAAVKPTEIGDSSQDNRISELETELHAMQEDLQFKEQLIARLKDDPYKDTKPESEAFSELQQQLQLKDKTIRRLKESKQMLETQLQEATQQAQTSRVSPGEIAQFQAKIQDLQKQVQDRDKVIEGLRVSISVAEKGESKDSTATDSKLTEARMQIQKLNDLINQKNKEILRLEEYRGKDFIQRFEEERGRLEEQVQKERQSHQKLLSRISELEREMQETGTRQQMLRIREIKNLYEGLKRETRLYQAQIQEMRQKLAGSSTL